MNPLTSFLTSHEYEDVWLLIPPGLVSGTLDKIPKQKTDLLHVVNAIFYLNGKKVELGQIYIRPDQIYSGGVGAPRFSDETTDD
jgi:hypothetical protein